MQTFTRLFSIITFLLSIGFVAHALPTPAKGIAVRDFSAPASYGNSNGYGGDNNDHGVDVLAVVVDLKAKVEAILVVLVDVKTVAEAEVQVTALVADIQATVAVLVDVTVQLAAEVKIQIASLFVEILVAIVKVCASVSVRLGAEVCLALWAQIDIALHILLLTLNVCVGGLISLVLEICLKLDASIFAAIAELKLCVLVQVIVGLAAKITAVTGIVL